MADYGLDTTREGAGLNYCGLRKNARDLRRSLKKKRDKKVPLRRVFGDDDISTLRMKLNYALALYEDNGATFDDLRESVTTLEETERTARRVLGGAHPTTSKVERNLRAAQALLATSEAEALPAVQDAARVTDNKN